MTDVNKGNNSTDFVLSSRAFRSMALPGKDLHILKLPLVDIEYKRLISLLKCQFTLVAYILFLMYNAIRI